MNFKKEIEVKLQKVRKITYKEILKKPLKYFRALNFHGLEHIVIIIVTGQTRAYVSNQHHYTSL